MTTKFEHQLKLEELFNKNQLMKRMRSEFINSEDIDFIGYFKSRNIDPDLGIDILVQLALHKRADLPTLVGTVWSHVDNPQVIVDTLLKMAEDDCIDYDPSIDKFIVVFGISDDVQLEIDSYQYPLPMVITPSPVLKNRDTGYLLTSGSIILKKNHTEDDVCLDHINRMNSIKLSINWDVANMVKNQWRNLDKCKEGETNQDYQKRVKAFNKYDTTAKDVMTLLTQEGNEFHLTHKYDKRGRTYSQGYHCNYQGTSWNKAVLEFADKELID